LCQGASVAVVGGGNSAGQASVFLSSRVEHVYHIIRGKDLYHSMSRYLIDRIQSTENITLLAQSQISELHGDEVLESIVVTQTATGEQQTRVRRGWPTRWPATRTASC
jgi:thioredoxin reductase (NADPH)